MARSRKDSRARTGSDSGAGIGRGAGRSIDETTRDHLRAAVGGLLVGLPLLWTMEMWEHGTTMPPLKLLLLLGLAFAVVVGFNAVSGFRRERTWVELLVDALQGMGLSIIVAAAMLYVLGRLEPDLGLQTMVGRWPAVDPGRVRHGPRLDGAQRARGGRRSRACRADRPTARGGGRRTLLRTQHCPHRRGPDPGLRSRRPDCSSWPSSRASPSASPSCSSWNCREDAADRNRAPEAAARSRSRG